MKKQEKKEEQPTQYLYEITKKGWKCLKCGTTLKSQIEIELHHHYHIEDDK